MGLSCVKTDNVCLSDKAAEHIIRYIQENQLHKGDKLPNEQQLMSQLNASRGTIREAMRSLSSRGIVIIRQGSGTYIANSPGVSDDPLGLDFQYDKQKMIRDLLEIRLILEPTVAALCAKRATDQDLTEIQRLTESIIHSIENGKSHIEYDIALHCKIAECSGNNVLTVFFPELVKGMRMISETLGSYILKDVIEDHRRLMNAILSRDSSGAREAMRIHMQRNTDAVEIRFHS